MIAQTELTQQQKQNILRWYYTHPIKTDIPRPGESPLSKGKGDNDAWWEEGANLAEQAVASGNLRPEDESHLRVRPLPDNMRWLLRYPILVPATHCLMGEQDRDFFPSAAGLHNGGYILPVTCIPEKPRPGYFMQRLYRSWDAHNMDMRMLMGDLEAAVHQADLDAITLRSIQAELDVHAAIVQKLGGILALYAQQEKRKLHWQAYKANPRPVEGQERKKIREAAKKLREDPKISQRKAAKIIAKYCWCKRGESTIRKYISDLFTDSTS